MTQVAEPLLSDAARAEIHALAERQALSHGLLIQAITSVGGRVEAGLSALPAPARRRVETAAKQALASSYHMAARTRDAGALRRLLPSDGAHKWAATVTGALGGMGGLPTALIELPVTTTMIFRAVQAVAEAHGEDPQSVETRLECLRVFGAGGPGAEDDGIDTSFLGARMTLTGPALHGLLSRVAPRFAAVLGQKLASQAVPFLGAAAGAGTNYAFMDTYTELAHIHFGLRRLCREHPSSLVLDEFHRHLAAQKPPCSAPDRAASGPKRGRKAG